MGFALYQGNFKDLVRDGKVPATLKDLIDQRLEGNFLDSEVVVGDGVVSFGDSMRIGLLERDTVLANLPKGRKLQSAQGYWDIGGKGIVVDDPLILCKERYHIEHFRDESIGRLLTSLMGKDSEINYYAQFGRDTSEPLVKIKRSPLKGMQFRPLGVAAHGDPHYYDVSVGRNTQYLVLN